MTTMTAISIRTASHGHRPYAPARQHAPAIRAVGDATLADLRRLAPAAGVAMRLGLALLPVSALAGMFAWL